VPQGCTAWSRCTGEACVLTPRRKGTSTGTCVSAGGMSIAPIQLAQHRMLLLRAGHMLPYPLPCIADCGRAAADLLGQAPEPAFGCNSVHRRRPR
jgi:hypothetical protein